VSGDGTTSTSGLSPSIAGLSSTGIAGAGGSLAPPSNGVPVDGGRDAPVAEPSLTSEPGGDKTAADECAPRWAGSAVGTSGGAGGVSVGNATGGGGTGDDGAADDVGNEPRSAGVIGPAPGRTATTHHELERGAIGRADAPEVP